MKYIIDVPDVETEPEIMMKKEGFDFIRFEEVSAIPYDESDTAEQAWKIAQDILKDPSKDGMLNGELDDCFGTDDVYLIGEMSYAEVKAKYDAWQKRKNEIKIGDEVEHEENKGVVCSVNDEIVYGFYISSGCKYITFAWSKRLVSKTGRTFPELIELFEKMRNPNDNV